MTPSATSAIDHHVSALLDGLDPASGTYAAPVASTTRRSCADS